MGGARSAECSANPNSLAAVRWLSMLTGPALITAAQSRASWLGAPVNVAYTPQ